jgi:ligand-binding sensor domain-containing protein/signal transduction histidine kinase
MGQAIHVARFFVSILILLFISLRPDWSAGLAERLRLGIRFGDDGSLSRPKSSQSHFLQTDCIKPLYIHAVSPEKSGVLMFHRVCLPGLLLFVAGLCPLPALAAEDLPVSPFFVKSWDGKDGLPQNSVISLVNSQDGYLWLGTLSGLVRFDGIQFTVFDENNTRGLPSSRVVKVFEDSRRNIWIGTETEGVVMAQPDGKLQSADIVGRGSPAGRLMSVCEDESGAVWLYTADGQLWRHRNGRFQAANMARQAASLCRSVIAESGGRVWVGMDGGQVGLALGTGESGPTNQIAIPATRLDYLLQSSRGGYWRLGDGRVQRWVGEKLTEDLGGYPWGNARVSAACEDRAGNLIVGTFDVGVLTTRGSEAGVYWFNSNSPPQRISKSDGLSHNGVLSLCVDREGSLWVGTDGGGLNRVRRRLFTVPRESKGLVVQSLSENAEGGLWIGFNFNGLRYWRGNFVKDFGPADGLLNPNVSAVHVDRKERVWVGTRGGDTSGLYLLKDSRFEPQALQQSVTAIHEDRTGRLWFGSEAGVLVQDGEKRRLLSRRDGLSADRVRAIADDAAGNVWIGTEGGGLNRFRDGKFEIYRKSDAGLPSDNVTGLYVGGDDVVWVATGGGLARLREGRWTRYSAAQGLPINGLGYLAGDDRGNLWIGSSAGLVRASLSVLNAHAADANVPLSLRIYTEADGLPSRECTAGSQPAACRTRDSRLLLPTIEGIAEVKASGVETNPIAPPVLIESVLVDSKPQGSGAIRFILPPTIRIPPGRRSLDIVYTSLNLRSPERTRFRYRMEGFDDTWTDAGTRRVALYPRLAAGNYRFHVQAANEDGLWNETGASIAVEVEPPFWQTKTFLAAATLGLLGLVAVIVHLISTARLRRKMKQQAALEKDRARIARDLHDQLGASMTQLSLLAELVEADKDEPQEVEAHARQMTQTARQTTHTLDEIVWAVNPANDTLNGLVNYICKNAQDYLHVAGFKYRFDVPAELPATPLSPEVRHNVFLAAKEAVTNVVRHSGGTSAWVRLRLHPGAFTLEIADDGGGVPESARHSTRNGLRNMQKRMEDVGGKYEVNRAPEGGALIRLTAPVAKQKD